MGKRIEDKERRFIYYNKYMKKFQVLIRAFKRSWHVGYYASLEEAKKARDDAINRLPPEAWEGKRVTGFEKLVHQLESVEHEEPKEEEKSDVNDVNDILGETGETDDE